MTVKKVLASLALIVLVTLTSCTEVATVIDAGQTASQVVDVMQMVGDATCGAGK